MQEPAPVREEQPESTQERIKAVAKDLFAITRNVLLKTGWVTSPESQLASREASYKAGERTYTLAQLSKLGGEVFEPRLEIKNGQQVLEINFVGEGDAKSIYLITKTEGGGTYSVPLTETAAKDDRVAALLIQKLETALAELGTILASELGNHYDLLKRCKEVREALDAVLFLEKI